MWTVVANILGNLMNIESMKIKFDSKSPCVGVQNDVEFEWDSEEYRFPTLNFEGYPRDFVITFNMDVEKNTEQPIYDKYQFISFVGGAIGISLGFSLYGAFLDLIKCVMKRIEKTYSNDGILNSMELE